MVRKTSEAECAEMRKKQAVATVKKLNRRIAACKQTDYEYSQFLLACRQDVINAL